MSTTVETAVDGLEAIGASREAAPDWRYGVEVLLADGSLGALRMRARGTFTRPYSLGPGG